MTRHRWGWLIGVLVVLGTLGMAGSTCAGVLWSEDFTAPVTGWQNLAIGLNVTFGPSGGKMVFTAGTYSAAELGVGLITDPAFLALGTQLENVEASCVVRISGNVSDLYVGPAIRAQDVTYTPPSTVTGRAYVYTLSGYENGQAGMYLYDNGEDIELISVPFNGAPANFTDRDIYMKMSAETEQGVGAKLKGMMSFSPDFSNPFGVIEYNHFELAAVWGPGTAGLVALNQTSSNASSATFDDFVLRSYPYTQPGPGDANGDGSVNQADATILATNWLKSSGATWEQGDFTGDGKVNDLDASILAAHWLPASGAASVPEPGLLVLLAGAAVLLLWRRR